MELGLIFEKRRVRLHREKFVAERRRKALQFEKDFPRDPAFLVLVRRYSKGFEENLLVDMPLMDPNPSLLLDDGGNLVADLDFLEMAE